MENLPDSLYEDYTNLNNSTLSSSSSTAPASTPAIATVVSRPPPSLGMIFRWINDLQHPNLAISGYALQSLANNRHNIDILPLLLWDSPGTVATLLREVVKIYSDIPLPVYPQQMPMRMYNVLLMFQCIAYHPQTRAKFLKAKMPHYFYPLMDIGYPDKSHECIRLGAIGVIAHLLKAPGEGAAIRFLMDTGALRFCTRAVEIGSTDSKTLAVYILHKIMSTNEGLQYCCVLVDRFFAIDDLLKKLLVYLSSMPRPSSSLFSLIVACYARLSQKPRARAGLKRYTPVMLFDGTFASLLAEDPDADNYRRQLIQNLEN